MKQAKLFDICRPKQWKTISSANLKDKGFPVYGANGIIGYHDEYNHEKPTILITCRGATCGTINISLPFSYINGNAMALDDLKEDEANIAYLAYYLKFRKLNDVITGTAQPQITRESLQNLEIPLPPLSTQQHIAQILDRADELRQKRKQAIAKLDELLQATFIKMFGDPVLNDKNWELDNLENLTKKIGSGSTPKGGDSSYKDEGISLIRSLNVHDGKFSYKDLAFIDDEQANKLKNVIIEKNDVLLNITGASVARCCLVPDEVLPARVNQHVCILRVNDKISAQFLANLLIAQPMKNHLLFLAGNGATREALTKLQLQSLQIPIPPLALQHQFAQIAQQIETQKSTLQAQANELETLFLSLQKRAFSGDLVG